MCGIAGSIELNRQVDERTLTEVELLLDKMKHRGPDGTGVRKCSPSVVLGANRLAITDPLNTDADMPFVSADGEFTIVYNGEVYNHRELRKELQDYPFRTHSDTETVLAAYTKWGDACLDRFEGMFAFCIHKRSSDSVFFAVGPSGQKPLYFWQDGTAVVFASEISALIENPHRQKRFCPEGISEVLTFAYTVGPDTHIREIKRLQAGFSGTIDGSWVRPQQYYTIDVEQQDRDNIDEITEELCEVTVQSCKEVVDRLEVPAGALLSGGIDSSAVVQVATDHGVPLTTFSIGFLPVQKDTAKTPEFDLGDQIFDEFEYSRFMAERCQTTHHELPVTPNDYWKALDRWIEIQGEPLGAQDAACLVHLFQSAAGHCKVMLCGSGPDEILDGYFHGKQLTEREGITAATVCDGYYDIGRWNFEVDLGRLVIDQGCRDRVVSKFERFIAPYRTKTEDVLQLMQLINFHGRCTSYEYRQMDVISMRHSIETRVPLGSRKFAHAAFQFAPRLKHEGEEKWIFKKALERILPDKITKREKAAFPTPLPLWFTAEYEKRMEKLFQKDSVLKTMGLLDFDYLSEVKAKEDRLAHRNIFFRLNVLHGLLEHQREHITGL